MRRTVCVWAILAASIGAAWSEEAPPEGGAGMELWIKLGKPGENHKVLERMAGTWSTVTTPCGAPGEPSKGTEGTLTSEMILGGRFLRAESKGSFGSHPFESFSVFGYDNTKERFQVVSMDSTGTMFIQAEGTYDAATKKLTMNGEYDDPFSKGKIKMRFRWVWTFVDDDHMEMEMWEVPPPELGQEYKAMTMSYTRKK